MNSTNRTKSIITMVRRTGVERRSALVVSTVALFSTIALGAPPLEPTLAPFYSFDAASPTVADGTVGSADLLFPDPSEVPNIVLRGLDIGLGQPGDELDALSGPNSDVDANRSFAILVSVDRATLGGVPPDPDLVNQGVPYNVADQAGKGQAAGDQFMSLTLYTRAGGRLSGLNGRAGDNNTLLRNNYDEGGTDLSAQPPVSAEDSAAARGGTVEQDEVDCMFGTRVPTDPRGPTDLLPIYFSASADSPSLQLLPGVMASGANIYFNADPAGGKQTVLYASFGDLGLMQGDDISGMIVFDSDGAGSFDGVFNGQDQVLISLTRNSPSLSTLGDPGTVASSADVFSVDASGNAVVFARAAELGLDALSDSIDAVDFLPCTDATACALLHAIRQPPIPAVSTWGMIVMTVLMLVAGTLVWMRRRSLAV